MRLRNKSAPWKKAYASYMSRHKTWPEKKLWAKLRGNQLGVPIHAQKVLFGWIADFWCPAAKLVIECDGPHHLVKTQQASDNKRDSVLAAKGIKTIRFTAQEITNNLPAVVAMIGVEIERRTK